ncbi:ATP-dependent helicase [Parasphingorhabdus sp.]|uniref:ATP-dependent helicase n=1 Tax=Parasphingorhabdus sp. TaxID=2709688 RepID=UPI002B2755B5|nr:ATP-dependent helicase [Parasphingorhabdus sp.]
MAWDDDLLPGTPAYNIANSDNSRVRVVAGPGTGKSFAMKRRVARLLEEGVAASSILPVTFTRVAAEDLHRELVGMETPHADELNGTTLHSLALKFLSRNHVLEITNRQPRPLNDFELEPLYSDLHSHGGKRALKKKILAYHAAWARLQDDDPADIDQYRDADFEVDLIRWLQFHRGMLIGEVIPYFYQYLRDNPHCEERSEYSHILVDEFQDLNKVEQEIIRMLSDNADVCIVGDDDQSIYSFKFAHPEGIQSWCDENGNADDLELIDCRRCPGLVVRIANHLIAESPTRDNNRELVEFEANGEGEVRIIQYQDLESEVKGIAGIIEELMGNDTHPGEIIVLAQRKKIGTYIYEELVQRGIPSKSYYQEAELGNEITQENFAYLKLTANQDDRVALRWLVGRNSGTWLRGGYAHVREHSEQSGLSPWQILTSLADGDMQMPHTGPLISAFKAVANRTVQLQALLEGEGLGALIDDLFPEDDERWRDIRQLALDIVATNESLGVQADMELSDFVGELSYAIAQPEIPSEIQDVRIMSLHKSKGLSAAATIVASCVEGVLPRRPDDDLTDNQKLADIEEQRRLLFVGITRVKAKPTENEPGRLFITLSRRMGAADARQSGIQPANFEYGEAVMNASRFLQQLGPSAPEREAG